MIEFEKVLIEEQPEILVVVGDVNSTLACTIVASEIRYSQINDAFQVPFVHRNKDHNQRAYYS
jgi:UDP-N-acetylglucosamine 2-epimerase (non-hydrolysing)